MAKIFVSYRRGDTADITGRICDRLESQFGRGSVFMDVDTIPFGVDFRQYINQAVGECDVVLAVIGAGWLAATDDDTGRRRLDNPDDFVRIEIEWALQRGIPLIPVLVRRVAMPGPEELPPGLQELAYRNAAEVRSGREFHTDMDRLMRDMQRHLLGGPEEAGTATGEGPASQSTAKAAPSMTETEGQCPECGRRNPAERKYCGGCGEPLFEPCLECQYVNAAWDKFCGQCGDDLAATRRARVQALEARQQQIEGLRKDSRHTEAIRMLEEMAAIEHPRLKPFRAWAQEWLSAVRAELEGLQRDREESARVAAEELSRHDYEAAIRSLEQIPEPLRGVKIQSLLADSRNKANEVMSLAREIRQAAELRRFESLGMKIRRLVSLKPHDGNVREVVGNAVGQVVTLAEARSAEHDYAQVVELLGQLPAPQRDAKARHLLEDAQTTLAEIGSLEVELKDVGCLEALEDLFSRLQNLRDRKPRYEEVNALVARLQERVAGAAERSITEHRYHEAVDLLRQVPPALRSDAVRNCLKESRAKAGKVSALANSIREARRAGNVKETFVHLKAFLELIPDHPEGRKLRERLPRETANKARRLCRVEHDYGEAVALLEDVPESLRSVEIRRLLEDCRAMAAETDRLTEEIDVEARRSWPRRLTRNGPERSQGQLANLERLLTLQPKNRHARSLLKGMIAQVEHSVTAYGTYSPVLRAVMFTPDGTHVLVAHSQGVDKWQLESGSTVNVLDSTWGKVTCIACSRDGTQMLCGREGGNVELWDLRRDSERQRGDDERSSDYISLVDPYPMDSFRFLSERVFSIILAENDTVLLAAGDLTAICMWPLRSKDSSQPPVSVPRTLVGHTDAVTCLAVGPDPHMLLSGSRDGTVRAWNLQMEREQWRSPVLPSPVTSLAVSPDGRYALCGYDDGALRLWRLLAHARERQAFQGHEGPITSVTFTPDGKRAVSTSEDKTVRVWDVASGRELGRSSEHSAAIVTAAVSPGGSFVLCGGADGHLFLRFLPPPD